MIRKATNIVRKGRALTWYLLVIIVIMAIATHNECPSTAAIISGWFVMPMGLSYGIILKILKRITRKICFLVALINTVVVFAIFAFLGSGLIASVPMPL